jgi:DNA-binding MarR family transcriptional regulator
MPAASEAQENPLWPFAGFLVRRLWQIHVAMFMDETKGTRVTPVQFSILLVLHSRTGMDQVSLGAQVGVDRSNLADSLRRMQRGGLIDRRRGSEDRRVTIVSLTRSGRSLFKRLEARVARSHVRLVEDLAPRERPLFLNMLQTIVGAKNELGRARYAIRFPTRVE